MDAKTIAAKQFARGAFGSYKSDDVDTFFQETVAYVRKLELEQENLLRDMRTLAVRVEEYRASEEAVQEALIKAQKYGNRIINDAEKEAEEIASAAKTEAAETISVAQERARIISNEAMEQTEQLIRDLKDKALGELNELKQKAAIERKTMENAKIAASSFKADLFELYRAHLDLINRIPDLSETDYQAEELPQNTAQQETDTAKSAETEKSEEKTEEIPVVETDFQSEENELKPEQPKEASADQPEEQEPQVKETEEEPQPEPEEKTMEFNAKGDTSVIPAQEIDGDMTPEDVRRTVSSPEAKPVYGRKFTDLKYGAGK